MLRSLIVAAVALLISSLISGIMLQYTKEKDAVDKMGDILKVLVQTVQYQDSQTVADEMSQVSGGYRITVMEKSGAVLGDSHWNLEDMQSHADRPEVIAALKGGRGWDQRVSQTTGENMVYVAIQENSRIYRISSALDNLNTSLQNMIPAMLVGILVAAVITPLVASTLAAAFVKPIDKAVTSLKAIDEGDYSNEVELPRYDELVPLVTTVNMLTRNIESAQQQLIYQKQKTEHLLDNMSTGLVLIDSERRIVQVNSAATRFFGSVSNITGKKLIHLTYDSKIVGAIQNCLDTGTSSMFDVDMMEKNGHVSSVHITPAYGDWISKENPKGVMMVITDVTQSRQMERMRSDFVANASHELKTPITSVRGFAELLASGMVTDPDKVQEYLLKIQAESDRMSNLIEDILRLSRVESSTDETKIVEVDLAEMYEQIRESLTPQLTGKNVTMVLEGEGYVMADPNDVRQVMGNLMDNAIKYNQPGGTVTVTLTPRKRSVEISVADTGIGIAPEHQARIFERFYRVDKGRSRKIGGTGLGLAIVKHVVAKYSGEIVISSKEGAGTTITVIFPYKGLQQ